MGRKRKSSLERQKARKESKDRHYFRHVGTEHMKSRRRWRKKRGANEATLNAFESLDLLWASTYTGSRTNTGCQDHVIAVLQDVDVQGWDLVRPVCEKELLEAWDLVRDVEVLVRSVANLEGPYSDQVQTECAQLLSRTQLWLAAEEQIIFLMDQGQEVLDEALYEEKLVWQ
ncbi:uncharacterized protein HD556DRAFT_1442720 [Suillus plorans]|uniref:Uncharacterized protein n=1 Tax=Suillus plorans TaxID=116603 RepID=A0A9P7AQY0_9AGAM|nr:uncharacterized protein HD556DRAFT_1442720 [Suillus plorans]KAG1794532.1 hypothetical protein HD556DRAFT_1442720 [Suillus plorans]